MNRLAIVLLGVLIASSASAQTASKPSPIKPLVEPNGPCAPFDSRVACQQGGTAAAQVNAQATVAPNPTCDFTTFVILTPSNLQPQMQACAQKLLTDSQAALASAKTANDTLAQECLTPGVAIAQAAVGTPATADTPASTAGPVLLFQKFREFVNAGGITNCQAWVNNTVTAAAGPAVGSLVGGALALAPK